MNQSAFEIQANFCKAMGNATRLQILHALQEGPLKVGEIAQVTKIGQPTISRQLGILRNVGVVSYQRHGVEIVYRLTDENIVEVCNLVRKVLLNQINRHAEVVTLRNKQI